MRQSGQEGGIMAERRFAFNRRAGYLEQVWGTHEALEQPMDSVHEPYLTRLMSLLGVPEDQRRFALPIMETTSKPVLRVPMSFVEITRESDPNDPKRKVIIKREDPVTEHHTIEILMKIDLWSLGIAVRARSLVLSLR